MARNRHIKCSVFLFQWSTRIDLDKKKHPRPSSLRGCHRTKSLSQRILQVPLVPRLKNPPFFLKKEKKIVSTLWGRNYNTKTVATCSNVPQQQKKNPPENRRCAWQVPFFLLLSECIHSKYIHAGLIGIRTASTSVRRVTVPYERMCGDLDLIKALAAHQQSGQAANWSVYCTAPERSAALYSKQYNRAAAAMDEMTD